MNRSLRRSRLSEAAHHALVALTGFACTLPALAGVSLPNTPLQTGSTIPPNVMLTFDDSGSMSWRYLYIHKSDASFPTITDDRSGGSIDSSASGDETQNDNFSDCTSCVVTGDQETSHTAGTSFNDGNNSDDFMVDHSSATNGLYYNPATNYEPWSYPDGTTLPDVPYTAAFQSHNFANYSWTAVGSAGNISTTSTTVDLTSYVNTYYVLKAADTSKAYNYYRYQIQKDGTIYRSELDLATNVGSSSTPPPTTPINVTGQSAGKNTMTQVGNFTLAAGVASVVITTTGGTANSDLYENKSSAVTTANYDNRSTNGSNNESITLTAPTAGTYYVGIYGQGAATSGVSVKVVVTYNPVFNVTKGVAGVGCNDTNSTGYDWRNCTKTTPTGRSEADERQNFANWYSYYETRIKTAKAGLTTAFSTLGLIPRVGFLPINTGSSNTTSAMYIPVASDNGLFEDKNTSPVVTNKSEWFKTVVGTSAASGTPLRTALDNTGKYYSDLTSGHSGAGGPYGPESGTDQLSCRQNFTILTTDGYWNDTFSISDQDSTSGPTHTDTLNSRTYTFPDKNYYTDGVANTLADVAIKYWKTDLMTGMADKVVPTSTDPAWWQHMTTFTISIGARGTLDPSAVNTLISSNSAVSWPTPVHDKLTTIDDLFHAAVNGHGQFVVASDPTTFVSALSSALSQIQETESSSSSVSVSAARLVTGAQLFQSDFKIGKWTGDVTSFPISTAGVLDTAHPNWHATDHEPTLADRTGYTYTYQGGGQTFPTTTQRTALGGVDVANYILGDHSKEVRNSGTYRNRTRVDSNGATVGTAFGDFIDSSPFFAPGDGTAASPSMLYVGGNDGMLHAFDANPSTVTGDTSIGKELFTYVPGGLDMGELAKLTDPKYIHQFFVDGAIVVSTKEQTKNSVDTTGKNILVGVLGRGGKSTGSTVYALDVTSPKSFGTSKVKWEFTSANLVNSLGTPIIAKINKKDGNGDPITAVIIPNGYNAANGHSEIFVLNIQDGSLVKELDSGIGGTDDANVSVNLHSNGMTTPKGWDADRDGTVDALYGGDLLGNVWVFDVSSGNTSLCSTSPSPVLLYTAKDASGNRQPITGGFAIGLNPATFDRWVFFGTGRYITSGDPADKSVQSLYGIIDGASTITSVTTRNSTVLKQRQIVAYDIDSGGTITRAFEQATAGDMGTLKGWYVDLLGDIAVDPNTAAKTVTLNSHQGERVVSDSVLLASVLLVASVIPSSDACDVGGSGFINALDAFTGAAVTSPFFDSNGDGVVDSNDVVKNAGNGGGINAGSIDLGVGMPSLPAFVEKVVSATGSKNTIGQVIVANPTNSGRISWREVLQGN